MSGFRRFCPYRGDSDRLSASLRTASMPVSNPLIISGILSNFLFFSERKEENCSCLDSTIGSNLELVNPN